MWYLAYPAWRKLGDVIASILAMGYHERTNASADVSPFIVELRKTAFARVYSADKNFAILLGRSPRMSKRFCHFQTPKPQKVSDNHCQISEEHDSTQKWDSNAEACYRADSRWSALCASLKEDILVMLLGDRRDVCDENIR